MNHSIFSSPPNPPGPSTEVSISDPNEMMVVVGCASCIVLSVSASDPNEMMVVVEEGSLRAWRGAAGRGRFWSYLLPCRGCCCRVKPCACTFLPAGTFP